MFKSLFIYSILAMGILPSIAQACCVDCRYWRNGTYAGCDTGDGLDRTVPKSACSIAAPFEGDTCPPKQFVEQRPWWKTPSRPMVPIQPAEPFKPVQPVRPAPAPGRRAE